MTVSATLGRAHRAIEFARHMPFAKIIRRSELSVRRAIGDRLRQVPLPKPHAVARAPAPPTPLFAPRTARVERVASGWSFTFLNRGVAMHGPGVDWTAPGSGPEHQLWRMNLHYMEYLEGVDDSSFATLLDDWIAANGAPRPGAWRDAWNAYALSLRAVVWMQELARRGGRLPTALIARAEASLACQLVYLERNLETDLGGNHLVKNIKALIWGSVYFTCPEAERWRSTGLSLLDRELSEQILADGMHYERSPSYHCQVLADLLEVRHALRHDPLGGRLDDALWRMAEAAADLTHPDGGVALFNDAGLNMAYSTGDCLDACERVLSRRPGPRAVFALPAAGYYGMRSGDMYLVADCGRIAPDDLPAHGHGDVLSFELSVGGERMVVDPGVYEYIEGPRRYASRTAASHNTLVLDGADQADFFSAFRCGRRPDVAVRRWEPRAGGFVLEGTHNGFSHVAGQPRHVRRFDVSDAQVVIEDRIEGRTDRQAAIGFLLHPGVECEQMDDGIVLASGSVRIRLIASVPLGVAPGVWWPDLGHEIATHRIVGVLPAGTRKVTTWLVVLGHESGNVMCRREMAHRFAAP